MKRHGESRTLWYHIHMKKTKSKHEIFVKLQKIVNSKEGLWWKMRDLAETHDYLVISDYYERVLMKLDVLEADLGPTENIAALRAEITGHS